MRRFQEDSSPFARERPTYPKLGKTPRDDASSVMRHYKLAPSFPPAVLREAKRVAQLPPEPLDAKRRDLRRTFIFTCDPVTARDYDDAISLETDRRGNRVLGVHIADVAHYVRPGSALDREAYRRSTSVYLCDRVVPMLPEALCNGVCSLVPNEDRLAFSVFMTFDKTGAMIHRTFAKTIIRSKMRLTYEEVMALMCGKGRKTTKIAKTVRALAGLTQQLRANRFVQGALDLEVPEAEVLLDADGTMTGIVTRPYDESHQMIEECMVAANEAVAQELWTRGIKILARLHEAPDPEALYQLRADLRGLGVKVGNLENPNVFARFLQSIKKHPLYSTIAMMVLRSMKRAVYDGKMIGHFGLAKKFYAHFTSPIRRYPDLTVHRQLATYLLGKDAHVPPATLAKWAEHTTACEETATEAERALLEMKKYRYLADELDSGRAHVYSGVISSCMPFGCFVDLPELAVSGLVHISQLANDYVQYNASDHSLSTAHGESWHSGDRMNVCVTRIDFDAHKLDFIPVRKETSSCKKSKKKGKRTWN